MKYIVQVKADQINSVVAQMKAMGITPSSVAFNFITTPDIPSSTVSTLKSVTGVVSVRPESSVTIQVVAIESKLSYFFKLAKNPLTLPQAISFTRSADAGTTKTPTSTSRKIVGSDYAESIGITGAGIKVAVIDTGIAPNAQGSNKYVQIGSTLPGQPNVLDEVGHGTWCATCINGNTYKTQSGEILTLQGVAPDVEVGIVKCLGYIIGAGTDSSILQALEKARDWGADIISASLGSEYTTDDPSSIPQCLAIKELTDSGIIVCFANGNSGPNSSTVGVPANEPSVISVGAIDPITGLVAEFSSRGPTAQGVVKPDLVAPGVTITSCATGWIAAMQLASNDFPGTASISGTSMATPHAAATIALGLQYARSQGKTLTNDTIKQAMFYYGEFPGTEKNNDYGFGLLTFQKLKSFIDERL